MFPIQSYFDVFLLEHPWQRQFPVLVPRRYDVMPSDDVMILAPARLWRHTFRAVFSCSFLPKEFISFVFTTWLCEQHSHIVWMVPCQVNRCFIIQYITRPNHIYMIYPTPTKNLDLLGVQILQKTAPGCIFGYVHAICIPGCKSAPAQTSLSLLGQKKKKICVFTVTCWKKLGSVGRKWFFFLILFFITELMFDGI